VFTHGHKVNTSKQCSEVPHIRYRYGQHLQGGLPSVEFYLELPDLPGASALIPETDSWWCAVKTRPGLNSAADHLTQKSNLGP